MKRILVGLLAGILIFAGIGEVSASKQTENELWAKETAAWFEISEKEILKAIEAGKKREDIDTAAMISRISGKSLTQVLSMKSDWGDVMKKLGISPQKFGEACREMMVRSIAMSGGLSESTVKNLLHNNYHPRDIKIAGRLAKASGKDVQEILDSKKINQRWIDVAKQLNVAKDFENIDEEDDEIAPPRIPEPPAE